MINLHGEGDVYRARHRCWFGMVMVKIWYDDLVKILDDDLGRQLVKISDHDLVRRGQR